MAKIEKIDENAKKATLTLDLDEIRLIRYWILLCERNSKKCFCLNKILMKFGKSDVCSPLCKAIDQISMKLDRHYKEMYKEEKKTKKESQEDFLNYTK